MTNGNDSEAETLEKQGFSGRQKSKEFLSELTEQVLALENVAKKAMTKEAISRYGNLKLGHTELAIKAIAIIAQAIQTNQIQGKITDEQFKELLREIFADYMNFANSPRSCQRCEEPRTQGEFTSRLPVCDFCVRTMSDTERRELVRSLQ